MCACARIVCECEGICNTAKYQDKLFQGHTLKDGRTRFLQRSYMCGLAIIKRCLSIKNSSCFFQLPKKFSISESSSEIMPICLHQ